MKIKGNLLTTGIGSLPHLGADKAVKLICENFDIPFWPQLPRRDFRENMYVQNSAGLGQCVVMDEKGKKMHVDCGDPGAQLSSIYEAYLAGDHDLFKLGPDFAKGFYEFLKTAGKYKPEYIKGQVTGPVSFGLSVVDEKGKALIYNDIVKDGFIVKSLEMQAEWQIRELKKISEDVIIFLDEPYLASFGSSFVNIERRDIILMLNAVIDRIHSRGALAGIHCCGNTDWSMLIETKVDIINFDAYAYSESILLYAKEIGDFLKRGGYLAWGIVPTSEDILKETGDSLFKRLSISMEKLSRKSAPMDLITANSILTPSCGMGTLTEALAEDIISKLGKTAKLAREKLK